LLSKNENVNKKHFSGFFLQARMMHLLSNKNWIFSIFSVFVLTAGLGYSYAGNLSKNQSEMVELTDLSDADIDLIVEVKSEMYAASIDSY